MVLESFKDTVSRISNIFTTWRKRKRGDDDEDKENKCKKVKLVKDYTITPEVKKDVKFTTYYQGQELQQTESRQLEFKAGGVIFKEDTLKPLVRKYASAFLNSEGGSLLCGVSDQGKVQGVFVNAQDWKFLTDTIDRELQLFRPPLSPSMYSLKKYPVIGKNGQSAFNNCVVELNVCKGVEGNIYESGNYTVYMRRDGGVQGPLKPLEIKDLVISKYLTVLESRKKKKEKDDEVEVKKKRLQAKNIQVITID